MSARRPLLRCAWALLAAALSASPATATWNSRGNVVDDDNSFSAVGFDNLDHGHAVAPDGQGGLIVGYVGPGGQIRANRLDGESGNRLWGLEGTVVNNGNSAGPVHTVSDSAGGCWMVWQDQRVDAPGLYMQRLDGDGLAQLAAGGVRLSTSLLSDGTNNLDIAVTPQGRLLVAYWEGDGLHVQRVLPGGGLNLGATGVLATTDAGPKPVRIVAFGENALVVWGSARATLNGNPGTSRILANRVNAGDLTPEWGTEGVVVIAATGVTATLTDASTDGTSLFIAFLHDGTGPTAIRGQKFNASGLVQWGTAIAMEQVDTDFDFGLMKDIRCVADGTGGLLFAWVDGRNFNKTGTGGFIHHTDLYGQRLNSSGVRQWAPNGSPVDSSLGTQEDLRICSDRTGGMFLAYTDLGASPDANGDDVSAARVNNAGTRLWKDFITNDNPNDTEQFEPMLEVDGFGNLLVAWTDERFDASGDIYGLRLPGGSGGAFTPSFTVTSPNGGESFTTPDSILVTWTSNISGNVKIEVAQTGQPRQLVTASTPNDGAFPWKVNGGLAGTFKIFVSDAADGSPVDSSNTTFTLCARLGGGIVSASLASGAAGGGLASGDFNEDGILDLAIGADDGIQVRLGSGAGGVGNGGFGASTLVDLNAAARAVAVGDLNDDGRLDLVAATPAGMFRVLGNGVGTVGDGTFGTPAVFATNGRAFDVELADLNEDGILDAVVTGDSTGVVSRFLGSGTNGAGTGGFGTRVDFTVQSEPRDVLVQDLDLDGILDLVVANRVSNSISFLRGSGVHGIGTGGFAAAVNVTTPVAPVMLAAADVIEGGLAELVVAHAGPSVTVYQPSFPGGTPAFTAVATSASGAVGAIQALVPRDFSRDGRLDLALYGTSGDAIFLYGQGPAGQGNGSFRSGGAIAGGGAATGQRMLVMDALEDGHPDLVVHEHTGEVVVYPGAACGLTLDTALDWTSPAAGCLLPESLEPLQWSRGDDVTAVHLELSRDGGLNWERLRSGLAPVLTSYLHRVRLPAATDARLRVVDVDDHNNAAMSPALAIRTGLGSATVITLPDTGRDALVADFNEDGISDLAVAHRGGVRLLLGQGAGGVGNGTFATGASLPSSSPATQVAAADLDDDGILDLVIGTDAGYEVRRGLGAGGVGNGTFGGAAVRDHGNVTRDLALGDFNEDGVQDLAFAPRDSAFVFVAPGLGTGGVGLAAFAEPARVALPARARAIEIADVNDDGIEDLLAIGGSVSTGQIYWLRGLGSGGIGNGSFAAALASGTLADPQAFAILDANTDDILDLVVGAEAEVRLHLGNGTLGIGNGGFASSGDIKVYESGERVSAIAVSTLDGSAGSSGPLARDLALVSESDDDNQHTWVLMRNPLSGNEAFAFGPSFTFGRAEGLVLGDFNEDGYEDVALWSATSPQLRVALGNCSDPGDTFTSPAFVTSPNGGETLPVGANHTMTFANSEHLWDVDVSRDNGASWENVARYVSRPSFSWTVTAPHTGSARVRVRQSLSVTAPPVDESNAVFTIGSASVDAPGAALPAAIAFSPAWPNPSRGDVRFELALPARGDMNLDILDAQGRRVASLGGRDLPAGRHVITWAGRDLGGAPVAAGVYFARLRSGAFDVTRRIVRIP